jgi:hypothetical protein
VQKFETRRQVINAQERAALRPRKDQRPCSRSAAYSDRAKAAPLAGPAPSANSGTNVVYPIRPCAAL